MKWLRIRGRKQRHEYSADEQAEGRRPADGPQPRLMLLVCDASGPGSYRLHTFEDATSALAFVQFWFPKGFDHGIIAFWAAHQEPVWRADSEAGTPAEAVILVRDEAKPGIVYPYSLSNMSLAHSWIAKEAARGLNLRSVLVYWAASVRIETDGSGAVRLSPAAPPPARAQDAPANAREVASALPESKEIVEEATRVAEAVSLEFEESERDAGQDTPMILEEDDLEPQEETGPKRWKQREEPFQGFGSPEGKF
jgi:hypothetical protein